MRGYYDLKSNSNIEIVFRLNHQMIGEQTKIIAKELEEGKVRESWEVRAYYRSKEEQAREIIRDVYLRFLGKIMVNLQRDFKKTVSIKEIKEKEGKTKKEAEARKEIESILIAKEAERNAKKKEKKKEREKKELSQIEKKRERKRERELQRKVRESEMEKGIIWI